MPISEDENIVVEDLRYLEHLLSGQDILDQDLRRSSTVLRQLLIDKGGLIERVAKRQSLRPKIEAPINEKTAEHAVHYKETYLCLAASTGQLTLAGFRISSKRSPPAPSGDGDFRLRQELSIGKFKQQTCIVVGGVRVTRENLIKYVANKLGGAHYDTNRKKKNKITQQYSALDAFHSKGRLTYKLGPFTGIYLELYATAKHVVDSPDIQDLVSTIASDM